MKLIFSLIILLTIHFETFAQSDLSTTLFTVDYGTEIFSKSPKTGRFTKSSLPYAMTYISAHKDNISALMNLGDGDHPKFVIDSIDNSMIYDIVNIPYLAYLPEETTMDAVLRMNFKNKVTSVEYKIIVAKLDLPAGVSQIINLRGDTTTLVNMGNDPGRFVGVITGFRVKLVDITDFYPEETFVKRFENLYEKSLEYYNTPLVNLIDTLSSREHYFGVSKYSELFHRFQIETTSADISIFSPQNNDDILWRDITRGNIRLRDSLIGTLELRGDEIVEIMERISASWFRRMKSPNDDMLNVSLYNDKIYPRLNCFSLYGVDYQINLLHPKEDMVSFSKDFDETKLYKVACSQRFARYIKANNFQEKGDYMELLCDWLKRSKYQPKEPVNNWRIVPENWSEIAKGREINKLF